jgi:uncharacterized protein (UPF0210 family)
MLRACYNLASFCLLGTMCALLAPSQTTKPKIRALTAFIRIERDSPEAQLQDALTLLHDAEHDYQQRGYEVETVRITTQPFAELVSGLNEAQSTSLFHKLNGLAKRESVILNVGPAMLADTDPPAAAELLAKILAANDQLHGSVIVAQDDGIRWNAVQAAANTIKYLAEHTPNSNGNFQFAVTAMLGPYGPFFPGSYHVGPGHQFSVGFESANVVKTVLASHRGNLADAEKSLATELSSYYLESEQIAIDVAKRTGWSYAGLDPTPAPEGDASIGDAIEKFTGAKFGSSGTLTAAALITRAVKAVPVKQVGYAGLMVAVLEDNVLAQRWSEASYNIDSLLAYSAVCGTGLDTVPLPGAITEEQLARIIGDVATLAYKWKKPLSARLLPVAGKKAGDRTDFNNPHLTNAVLQQLP